ncbi:MAG: hypothetical protein AAGC60_13590 [Acidobacteriota bacterium]
MRLTSVSRFVLLLTAITLWMVGPAAASQAPQPLTATQAAPAGVVDELKPVSTFVDTRVLAPAILVESHGIVSLRMYGLVGDDFVNVTVVGLDAAEHVVLFGSLSNQGLYLTDRLGADVVLEMPVRGETFDGLVDPTSQGFAAAPCLFERTQVFAQCGTLAARLFEILVNGNFSWQAWLRALLEAALRGAPCSNALIAYNECLQRSGTPSTGFGYYYGCFSRSSIYFLGSSSTPSDDQCSVLG